MQLNSLQNDMVVPPEYLKTTRIAAGLGDGEGTTVRARALAEIQHFNFTGTGLLACYERGLQTALDLVASRVVRVSRCGLCDLNSHMLTDACGTTAATIYD